MEKTYYRSLIQEELVKRQKKNPNYSLRAFAKFLGLGSGPLSEYLSAKRIPSYAVAAKIAEQLDLTPEEEDRFMSSIAEAKKQTIETPMDPEFKARKVKSRIYSRHSDNRFRVMREWYYSALLSLVETEKFRSDPNWIAMELGISILNAKKAIKNLTALEFLEIRDGNIVLSSKFKNGSKQQSSMPKLRRKETQVLERSVASLERDPPGSRFVLSRSIAINPKKLSTATELFREFESKIISHFQTGRRTEVYEFAIILYPAAKKPGRS